MVLNVKLYLFHKNNDMTLENTKAQMRKGVLELCVLAIVSDTEAYPSDIIEKLKEQKLIVVEGTLYPLLNRLKDAQLLDYNWRESNAGPPRKYYSITEQGTQFLNGLVHTWSELNEAVNHSTKKIVIHE
jgi:PadR family transcriptional regulator, regulatory protein PadR